MFAVSSKGLVTYFNFVNSIIIHKKSLENFII